MSWGSHLESLVVDVEEEFHLLVRYFANRRAVVPVSSWPGLRSTELRFSGTFFFFVASAAVLAASSLSFTAGVHPWTPTTLRQHQTSLRCVRRCELKISGSGSSVQNQNQTDSGSHSHLRSAQELQASDTSSASSALRKPEIITKQLKRC